MPPDTALKHSFLIERTNHEGRVLTQIIPSINAMFTMLPISIKKEDEPLCIVYTILIVSRILSDVKPVLDDSTRAEESSARHCDDYLTVGLPL